MKLAQKDPRKTWSFQSKSVFDATAQPIRQVLLLSRRPNSKAKTVEYQSLSLGFVSSQLWLTYRQAAFGKEDSMVCAECGKRFRPLAMGQTCCTQACQERRKKKRDQRVKSKEARDGKQPKPKIVYKHKPLSPGGSKKNKKYKGKLIKQVSRKKPFTPHPFYSSPDWRRLRIMKLHNHNKDFGPKCSICRNASLSLHVDHIKPRSKYPELELDYNNLQVLCAECNIGKSNLEDKDLRRV